MVALPDPRATLRDRGVVPLSTPVPWAQAGPVHTYVLRGPPHVVIDTGYAFAWPELVGQLDREGIAVSEVGAVLLTHGHPDHASAAGEILACSGAALHLHPADHPKLAPDYLEAKATQYLRLRPWFMREGVPGDEFDAYIERFRAPRHRFDRDLAPRSLTDGQLLDLPTGPLRVVWTPGHTPGHVLFLDEARRLAFSGDQLLADTSPNPVLDFDEDDRRYRSFPDYLRSLDRIEALDVDLWCPGHGPLFADARGVIASLQGFYADRQASLVAAVTRGEATRLRLSRALLPAPEGVDRFRASSEVVGHVDAVVERGALRARTRGGHRTLSVN